MDLALLEKVAHFCDSRVFHDRLHDWRGKYLYLFEDCGKLGGEQPLER